MSTPTVFAPTTGAEVVDLVREAHDATRPLRIVGAGRWSDAGHSVHAHDTLSLASLRGIVAYRPDDLTITVEAGTTLAEIDAATRERQQWCPLFPWGDDDGTLGATLATATTGPFAETLGRPRDLALGIEAVDGTARMIVAGGRVVKNVAGFDLTRAIVGAWGTLAVITRAHLRLRPRPQVDETLAFTPRDGFPALPVAPLAAFALTPELAARLGVADARWLVRLGGNATAVAAMRAVLASAGRVHALEESAWSVVRRECAPPSPAAQWRWDTLSRQLRDRFDPLHILNPGLLGELR